MASKKVLPNTGYARVEYDYARRILRFTPTGGGAVIRFLGVPPEVFYGMPSGQNVQNFIELKLRGRFAFEEEPEPPCIDVSLINRTVSVTLPTEVWVWKQRDGDPRSWPDDPHEAFELFNRTLANRSPDQKIPRKVVKKTTITGGE